MANPVRWNWDPFPKRYRSRTQPRSQSVECIELLFTRTITELEDNEQLFAPFKAIADLYRGRQQSSAVNWSFKNISISSDEDSDGDMSRSAGKALVNGLSKEEPRSLSQLERQLSDKQRQLLLSQQLVKQLDKIRATHHELQAVSTRLVRQRVDIDLDDKKEFDRLTNEVKKLEDWLKVLRSVEQNGVDIDVHLMPYKKMRGNKYLVADREVSLRREGIGE